MDRKLFFFDVDGTLIDENTGILPVSAAKAVSALRRAGHLVLLNSGRTLCFLEYQLENLGLSSAVCGCGTQIIVNGSTIFEKRVEHRRGLRIRQILRELPVDAVLEAQEALYYSDRPFHYPDIMEALLEYSEGMAETEVNALGDLSYDFDKICIQTNPLATDVRTLKRLKRELYDFECIDRGRGFYEWVPVGCSKGSAVSFLQEYYGIAPGDIYVFGDSANDLTMFRSGAGNRILMGTHDTVLEPYATFVTRDVLDDGIDFALRSLGVL